MPLGRFVISGSWIGLFGSVWLAGELAAQGNSSLSVTINEAAATEVAGAAQSFGNEERREETSQGEAVKVLTASLAESNAEAELFRRKYAELQLRMEALGLEAADRDKSRLEQRLLSAVSDLQLVQQRARPVSRSNAATDGVDLAFFANVDGRGSEGASRARGAGAEYECVGPIGDGSIGNWSELNGWERGKCEGRVVPHRR